MKKRLDKLLARIRDNGNARWPWESPANAARGAALPATHTGWTVHRDVALRLKRLPVDAPGTSIGDAGTGIGTFKIRLAGTHDARHEASFLVQQRYARRGYRASASRVTRHVWTFAAYDEGRLAGTVSLRLDSPEGLAADHLFRAEIDAIRDDGRRVCEFTRLAVVETQRSQPVLAGLFHTVYLFARRVRNFDCVVIEVNPRHVGFYRRSLGFDVIGPERHNPNVEAPAVLMAISFADIAHHLHRHAASSNHPPRPRSLYAYGFTPAEAVGVLGRLRTLDAAPPADATIPG